MTDPGWVGFSDNFRVYGCGWDGQLIREKRPKLRLYLAMCTCCLLGAPILSTFQEIDYLVIGEGEGALLGLADNKPLKISSLIYRDETGKIRINPRRDRILDLDELPLPAYEKLGASRTLTISPLFAYEKRFARR